MDKQNVPKAVTLLQCLVKLKDLSEPMIPSENQKRKAIIFIFAAEFMGYFMRPFIDVDMNLTEQIENLATYTFLAAAIHIKHGTNCVGTTMRLQILRAGGQLLVHHQGKAVGLSFQVSEEL